MRSFVVFALVASLATPVLANSYRSLTRLYVNPINADVFEVIEARGEGGTGIWCSAGDYVQAIGRDVPQQRLYLLKGRGPSVTAPGQRAVTFTIAPDEELRNSPRSYSLSTTKVGTNYSVGHALALCRQFVDDMMFF